MSENSADVLRPPPSSATSRAGTTYGTATHGGGATLQSRPTCGTMGPPQDAIRGREKMAQVRSRFCPTAPGPPHPPRPGAPDLACPGRRPGTMGRCPPAALPSPPYPLDPYPLHPCPTLPYPTLPFPALPSPTLSHPTLPDHTLPYPTLPSAT